ncbi:heavy metal-associated isoprenylated plant protein [Trifolium repens]|nr:heavy metal-associated isoprenylated plant protein [Trifolium repens]
MKNVVLKVYVHNDKIKQKVMKTASSLSGVESVSIDMKEKKLTLSGDIDPVNTVSKLRKFCHIEVVSVGPSKPKEEKKSQDKPFEAPMAANYSSEEIQSDPAPIITYIS